MALDPNINTREYQKFCEWLTGETAVRVCADPGTTTSITGALSILSPTDYVPQIITVTDVAVLYVRQPNSIALDFQNLSTVDPVFHSPNPLVTALETAGVNRGRKIGPQEGDNFSLQASKSPYLIAPTGKTVLVLVTDWIFTP